MIDTDVNLRPFIIGLFVTLPVLSFASTNPDIFRSIVIISPLVLVFGVYTYIVGLAIREVTDR